MHVAMILTNPFRPDIRVLKEATSLVNNGFRVSIISWDRLGEFPLTESINGISIYRIRIKSKYARGSSQVLYLFKYWILSFIAVLRLGPDIVHCHDLDTFFSGYIYSKLKKTKWVFDAHECYPEQMRIQTNPLFYKLLLKLEHLAVRDASLVITVNKSLFDRYKRINSKSTVVGNYYAYPHESQANSVQKIDHGIYGSDLTIIYIGGFSSGRSIIPLIQSSRLLSNVKIIIAGDGSQLGQIKEELKKHPSVQYLGWISQTSVYQFYQIADIVYYGLISTNKNNEFSTPNALFLSMTFGKPIITTNVGEVARIVRTENCGIVIEKATPESVAEAINQLRSKETREELGRNAHKAAANKYNWNIAEKILIEAYSNLSTTR